jgi:hypothetical protein
MKSSVLISVGCRLAVMVCLVVTVEGVWADVVVVANRSRETVRLTVRHQGAAGHRYVIPPNDVVPIPSQGGLSVDVDSTRRPSTRYGLDANSAYFLGATAGGSVALTKIGLGGDPQTSRGRPLPGAGPGSSAATITVKILVDEDERATQKVWEKRLRRRVRNASLVLEKYAAVRLRVVAVGTWQSDDKVHDFGQSLLEFERRVNPAPARLAIGFTSQYQISRGRTHMGGTRGPLRSHILIREWSQHLPERQQRLELLVHELGHFLGAVHSPEANSVMRPVLTSGKSRSAPLRFDPVNTLIMYLVGEEFRGRSIGTLADLTPGTRQRLRQIYGVMAQATPNDPTARKYADYLGRGRLRTATSPRRRKTINPLVAATRQVISAIVDAAQASRRAAELGATSADVPGPDSTDALLQFYVRRAAQAARKLPSSQGPKSLVLALGIALDDSDVLRIHPKTRDFVAAVEPGGQRLTRVTAVGQPTIRGRRELAKRFVVAAYLTAVLGREGAEAAFLGNTANDPSTGPSGNPDKILTATIRAGILFADGLLQGSISLADVADHFTIDAYLPPS